MLPDKSTDNVCEVDAGALLLFDEALPFFHKKNSSALNVMPVKRLHCLRWESTPAGGYAMTLPVGEHLTEIGSLVGVPVSEWPVQLDAESHRRVCRKVSDRAWEMVSASPLAVRDDRVLRMKINDRVFNRMEPMARVEQLLEDAVHGWGLKHIIVPWTADRYDTVERPGMLGFDCSGLRIVSLLERLKRKFGVEVSQLWPGADSRQRRTVVYSRAVMASARVSVLAARAVRDAVRPRPVSTPNSARAAPSLPQIGFIVGGAAPWYHTKPLVDRCQGAFDPVIIAHDIFRNPTTYKLLKKEGIPFTPIDGQISLADNLLTIARGVWKTAKMKRRLKQWMNEDTATRREVAMELSADLNCVMELDLYVKQIRAAIRKHRLRAVVTSNILDSLLSAGAEACRREGVPLVCIQNTTAAYIQQPIYADCDLYLAESEEMAAFMRSSGAIGQVQALGLPFYDDLVEARTNASGTLRKLLPNIGEKKTVSLIGAPENHDYEPLLKPLMDMIRSREDTAMIIRLHPRSKPNQHEELGRELESSGKGGRVHHSPLAKFLGDSDFVVATVSSTVQSALVMGVRPYCWIPPQWRMYADEANQFRPEIQNRWNEPSNVVKALEHTLDHEQEQRDWIKRWNRISSKYMTGADGKACERIVNRLRQIAA